VCYVIPSEWRQQFVFIFIFIANLTHVAIVFVLYLSNYWMIAVVCVLYLSLSVNHAIVSVSVYRNGAMRIEVTVNSCLLCWQTMAPSAWTKTSSTVSCRHANKCLWASSCASSFVGFFLVNFARELIVSYCLICTAALKVLEVFKAH